MLPPLKSELLVSNATALASWEYQRKAPDVEQDRALDDTKRGDASLGFVQFVGFWSHFDHETHASSWPLTGCPGVRGLADFIELHHRLEVSPVAGDVFLLASHRGDRHVRAGIVACVESARMMLDGSPEFVCTTIEGEFAADSVDATGIRSPAARLVRRRLSVAFGDCFIRWCDFAPKESLAALEYRVPDNLVVLDREPSERAA